MAHMTQYQAFNYLSVRQIFFINALAEDKKDMHAQQWYSQV